MRRTLVYDNSLSPRSTYCPLHGAVDCIDLDDIREQTRNASKLVVVRTWFHIQVAMQFTKVDYDEVLPSTGPCKGATLLLKNFMQNAQFDHSCTYIYIYIWIDRNKTWNKMKEGYIARCSTLGRVSGPMPWERRTCKLWHVSWSPGNNRHGAINLTTTPGFDAHLSYKIIRQNHWLRETWRCNVENSSILMTHDKCGWQLRRIRYSHVNIYTPPRRHFLSTSRFATYICCWAQAGARRWFGSVILVLHLWVAPSSSPLVFVFFSSQVYVHHLHKLHW